MKGERERQARSHESVVILVVTRALTREESAGETMEEHERGRVRGAAEEKLRESLADLRHRQSPQRGPFLLRKWAGEELGWK